MAEPVCRRRQVSVSRARVAPLNRLLCGVLLSEADVNAPTTAALLDNNDEGDDTSEESHHTVADDCKIRLPFRRTALVIDSLRTTS